MEGDLAQQVVYAIESGLLFIHRLYNPPWGLRDMGSLHHGFLGTRVIFPASAAFKVHGAEFPLLQGIVDSAKKARVLFVVCD